jgi:hypothetical protein
MKTKKEELLIKADIAWESCRWWEREIQDCLSESETVEKEAWHPNYSELIDTQTAKMEKLIKRGSFERRQLEHIEKEIKEYQSQEH